MFRRSLLFLFFAFLTLLSACVREPSQPLRVGTNIWPGYEPLYLAAELGYYKDTPIRLIQYPSSTEVMRAFQSGLLEVAALTVDEVLMVKDRGFDPQIVVVTDFSNGADVILGRSGTRTLHDLKGKKIGVESTALGAFFLTRALEKEGIPIDTITPVPLELSDHEEAFMKGKVDGLVTFPPVSSNLKDKGAVLLFDSSRIPGEIVDVLVVRKSEMEKHAECLEALRNGWFRAVEYLKSNPDDAAKKAAPREKFTPQQFLDSLKGIHIPDREEYSAMADGRDVSLRDSMERLNRMMVSKGLVRRLQNPVPFVPIDALKNR